MGLIINTNIASLNAQRNLTFSSAKLNKSFERLASGKRINTAGDDAAGLAISERFTSQIRGLGQAIRNANDAVSLVQVTEGALQESTSILQRIRELAVQAASDVNTTADRESLQDEIDQLKDELKRIGDTTTFNGQKLLDGSFTDKYFHVGMNFRETIRVRVRDARSETIGRWAVQTGAVVTTNALVAGDLFLNGVTVRATRPQDDLVSTTFATGSAIAKAAAINDSTSFTGISAYANPAIRAGVSGVAGGLLDQTNNITINGRTITGLDVAADDANDSLIKAINAEFDFTGVLASRDANGRIQLEARDGRNIELSFGGNGGIISGLDPANAQSVTTGHRDAALGESVRGHRRQRAVHRFPARRAHRRQRGAGRHDHRHHEPRRRQPRPAHRRPRHRPDQRRPRRARRRAEPHRLDHLEPLDDRRERQRRALPHPRRGLRRGDGGPEPQPDSAAGRHVHPRAGQPAAAAGPHPPAGWLIPVGRPKGQAAPVRRPTPDSV
jgi:flagellin